MTLLWMDCPRFFIATRVPGKHWCGYNVHIVKAMEHN